MKRLTRREMVGSAGLAAGASLLSGYRTCSTAAPQRGSGDAVGTAVSESQRSSAWAYSALDPGLVAERAYRIFPEGACMYAIVGGVISALADSVGEPFRSFPYWMMRYGEGGVGRWGSLCGVLNGGAALIGLFHHQQEKTRRGQLIAELFSWYETSALPKYRPDEPACGSDIPSSVANSVLCHVSVHKWCEVSKCDAFSAEKSERCRRLSADGAMKICEILNRNLNGPSSVFELVTEVQSCLECHGRNDMADATGKMRCNTCHTFSEEHP